VFERVQNREPAPVNGVILPTIYLTHTPPPRQEPDQETEA
jgi:hypothetical protein